jgi:hypothetical protein
VREALARWPPALLALRFSPCFQEPCRDSGDPAVCFLSNDSFVTVRHRSAGRMWSATWLQLRQGCEAEWLQLIAPEQALTTVLSRTSLLPGKPLTDRLLALYSTLIQIPVKSGWNQNTSLTVRSIANA